MRLLSLLLLASTGIALAQDDATYTLNDGNVTFRMPSAWTAIMEKSDGNPQAIVFQVPDPATRGTDDTASITVKTRMLKGPDEFPEALQNEYLLSRAQTGYEADHDDKDNGVHRYFVMRGNTRYAIRDRFVLIGYIAVQVRCQRPLLGATTREWTASYDGGCTRASASVQ